MIFNPSNNFLSYNYSKKILNNNYNNHNNVKYHQKIQLFIKIDKNQDEK